MNSNNDLSLKEMKEQFEKLLANEIAKNTALELENTRLKSELMAKNVLLENMMKESSSSSSASSAQLNDAPLSKKPIFKNITVPAKIVEPEKGSSRTYTAYLIEIESDTKKYTISKRYKQFSLLQTQIIRKFGEHDTPSLPAKANGLYFSSSDHTEKRRVGLQNYLQELLAHTQISQSMILFQFLKEDDPSQISAH